MENNLLHGAPLYYPSAKEWMWNYCIYLGPFTDSKGHNYDLGIYINHDSFLEYSNATVYGDEPGNYLSGLLYPRIDFSNEVSNEVIRRAQLLKLIPEDKQPVKKQKTSGIMQNFIEDAISEMENEYYMDQDDYPGL